MRVLERRACERRRLVIARKPLGNRLALVGEAVGCADTAVQGSVRARDKDLPLVGLLHTSPVISCRCCRRVRCAEEGQQVRFMGLLWQKEIAERG